MSEIKTNTLVTLANSAYNTQSNTYEVAKRLPGGDCLLKHPLAPEIFLKRRIEELNRVMPTLQSPVEKCLYFCQKHKSVLSHTDIADLEAFSLYFVLRKNITNKQRSQINSLCGKISSSILGQSLEQATNIIKDNEVLLDEFNRVLFNMYKQSINNYQKIENKKQRYSIFELAGFLMSQLDERHKGL